MNTQQFDIQEYLVSVDDDGLASFSQEHLLDNTKEYEKINGEYVQVFTIPQQDK